MLELMYITNQPEIARIAENSGVDMIFVDMEYIGKALRQRGMDTVQLHHTLQDVKNIAGTVKKAKVLVRVNPIHADSRNEIEGCIRNGADILMLPYFKTLEEVKTFLHLAGGKVKTMLLLETPEAIEIIDDILKLNGVNSIHIGLNDLSLARGMKFMFELLADGTIENLAIKFRRAGMPFGFGGIAALGKGTVPAEMIIREHYRLGSQYAILARSFCNTSQVTGLNEIRSIFDSGVEKIRELEQECQGHMDYFWKNRSALEFAVANFARRMN
ncbi:MAG: aldolase/citrate lyase family protein [Victivallales bacterium]